jgi:ubiquinone/menaquinone biosynthesis C-methylase UbiE
VKNNKTIHQQYFDLQSETWDNNKILENVERLENIFMKLPFDLGTHILDLGCGTGILVPILHKDRLRFLIECDISKNMLLKNRLNWKIYSSNTRYLNGNAEQLPVISAFFNTIISFAVLPHIPDKHAAYSEFYRTLAPGGHLVILHLMGSQVLNEFHKEQGAIVSHDRLRPASSVADKLCEFGFTKKVVMERDDIFLIIAQK